jgi:hypothetical protein
LGFLGPAFDLFQPHTVPKQKAISVARVGKHLPLAGARDTPQKHHALAGADLLLDLIIETLNLLEDTKRLVAVLPHL